MYLANKKGFTLIEMMVTVSILAILVTTVVVSFGPAREQARDAQRQTDLRTIEAALALYKNKYGQYPAGCNPPTIGNTPSWSGQPDTNYSCLGNSSQYIVGLAPEFLPELPTDPRLNGEDSGYVYTTNSDQTVYKFMALNTVETETVDRSHVFYRCDDSFDAPPNEIVTSGSPYFSYEDDRLCRNTPVSATNNAPLPPTRSSCSNTGEFATTYAVSAGFSSNTRTNGIRPERGREYDTEIVRCG